MQERGFTLRALIFGAILSFIIGAGNVYNLMTIQGSYMALDFTTPAAIFFIFWITLLNLLVNKVFPRYSFSPAELILMYIMMIVSCSIPTMGLTLYLVPLISGVKYYATPENQWAETILPHVKEWMIVHNDDAIRWFYEGIPSSESIPWMAWIKPLIFWIPLIVVIYLVMIFIMVLLRKQWMQKERLIYPLTKAPLELINSTENKIFSNKVFWLGFAVPFVIGCINAAHNYLPPVPAINLSQSVKIFRETIGLQFRISFPMIGFTYYVSQTLAFSLWFFCLLTTIEQGFFNMTGFGTTRFMPYNASRPLLGWQSLGALLVIVLYGIWVSRKHLQGICKVALRRKSEEDEDGIVSSSTAFWGTILGLLFIFFWLIMSGLQPLASVIFILLAFVVFIGITRVIVEGGLAATRAPVIAPVATNSLFGSLRLGPAGLVSLGLTFVYVSDVRTFVMASVANGLKMLENIKKRKRIIFWGILISILVTLFSSIWATLALGYKCGAINANSWFFVAGPQYPLRYIQQEIKNPQGPDWLCIGFMAIGAVITIAFQFMRTRFLWFPFHPLGFAFSTIMMTNALWFSIFIAWLIKSLLLKYGGPRIYEKCKPFFIGLIVGQFVVNGTWLVIDFFTGKTGNNLFWA